MYLPRTIADLNLSLMSAVFAGDDTATLNDALDSEGNILPTGFYAFTIDIGLTTKEFFVADLDGVNLASIKSIDVQGGVTDGFNQYHRADAQITITDWVSIQRILDVLTGSDGLDPGSPMFYSSDPTLGNGTQLATVAYVLSIVSGGAVSFDQQVVASQTLGETIVVNNVVYFKESDQRWYKASALTSSTFSQVKLGISKTAGNAGASATIAILGPVSAFSALTPGSKYYLSDTSGAISATAGTTEVFLGWALSATVLLLAPREIYAPTASEKTLLTQLQASLPGVITPYGGRSAPTGWLLCDGTAVSRSTYAALFGVIAPSAVFTVTIASPGVFSKTAHGLVAGDRLHFTTTGALPTGLSTNTDYYVISSGLTVDAFKVALSPGGAAINTSGSQSGVHTYYVSNFGKGDGSTTFNVPDLRSKAPLGLGATSNITVVVEAASVDTTADTFAVPDSIFPLQGQPVTLTSTGTLPAGLSLATTYYIIRVDSTHVAFATTQVNADAATPVKINITDQGTGVHSILYALSARTVVGQMGGEETHGLAAPELAAHTHTITSESGGVGNAGPSANGNTPGVALTTNANSGDTQHNNLQPYMVINYIIKT